MPAPPSPLRRSVRPHAPTMGTRLSPDASAGSGSGSGSGPSSRKRVREHVAVANGEAAEPLMRDAGPDDDDEYFDVDMEAQDAYDELDASARDRGHDIDSRQNGDGLFVPYYPHFGASDFDDEVVIRCALENQREEMNRTSTCSRSNARDNADCSVNEYDSLHLSNAEGVMLRVAEHI